jgi:fucose 4-O-acetylase-like acetyltransferase
VVALCALLVATGVSRPVSLKPGDLGTPILSFVVAILLSAAVLELCRVAASLIPWASNTIVLLGTTGFTVVLAHGGVLWLKGTPDAGGWDDFLLAVVVPWLIGIVALYTPASRLLTGASRRTLARSRV